MKGEGCEYLAPLDKGGLGGFADSPEALRRLRWRCRRGLLELDVLLERFAESRLAGLSQAQCGLLERLLQEADVDLLAWIQGQQGVPGAYREIIENIRTAV